MYTDRQGLHEYPFYATFYHLGVDESKPLDEQVEEKVISFETKCDINDKNNSLDNETIILYFPLDIKKEKVEIILGETMEVETYGITQRGRVLGVYPSQLGGVMVVCVRI